MPSLSLTKTAANGLAHDASHVNTPLTEVETWANTTKIDYLNVQDNGLRTSSLRTHAQVEAVRIKVRNATGSSIAANSLIYFNGTYSDGTNNYPTIAKAVAATSVGSTFFAQAVTTGAIANGADGTAAIFYELTGQNTSSGTVGDSVYLDTTAGGWTRTRPTGGQYVQVVGTITVVNASSGRVVLSLGSVPEHLTGGSSGLGATFQTLTVQGASGGAADIYHISDAGEDNADKWKISVADGGNMTWENYTSGSYAAKLTMTSAGAVTTAGALNIGSVSAAGEDTDKFLVLDSSSNVDYRTGAQVLSDIGAQASGTYTTLAFKTIAVSGQDNVVADAADDTLTLAAGTGITLTTNAGSDTVTITGTASPVTALNNATADELVTVGSTTTELDAEANLTFDGTTLVNTGQSIGVGEAPSTWHSGLDFIQIGGTLALASQPGVQASQAAYIVQNAHYDSDGSWEYQATDEASRIGMSSGNITFDNAASGTAGNDITWSERMRIDSSGNVMMDASGNFVASGFLNVENTANGQNLYVGARNTGFTQHVIRAFCYRTANSAYNFLDCQSDMAGSNDTEFKLRGDGEAYADGSWNNSGADYQEFFESSDGSALEVGKSVVMDGDKVRVYNASSDSADNIIGVVRPKADNKNSAVIGNTAWNHWTDKYLTDDWGVYLREDVTVWEWDDVMATESDVVEAADATYYEEGDDIPEDKEVGDVKTAEVVGVAVGDVVIKAGSCYERNELAKDSEWTPPAGATSSTQSVRKRNPDYDEERTYAPREERDEWNLIGLLGQVQIKANEPTRPTWIKMKQISDAVDLWLVR